MNKIKLPESDKKRLGFLCDAGDASKLIRAVEDGQKVVIVSNGQDEKEWFLTKYLDHLGVDCTYLRDGCVIEFKAKGLGRGGENRERKLI